MYRSRFEVNYTAVKTQVTLFTLLLSAIFLSGCSPDAKAPTKDTPKDAKSAASAESGLEKLNIKVVKEGSGKAVTANGDLLNMNYTGTLKNGKKFDSSLDRDQPFGFVLGSGQVIKGWDQGLVGMKVGEKRRLEIPYKLAYGDNSPSDQIPARSDLYFDVELLGMVKKGEEEIYDRKDLTVGSGAEVTKGRTIKVQYVGKLTNGHVFDKGNLTLKVGNGDVIPGFDAGVVGMKQGGKRQLTIPPKLAYGAQGAAKIPANQILVFEITVDSVS